MGIRDKGDRQLSVAQTLRQYAGTRWPTLNHKGRMSRLAGELRFGFRRVRSLYQDEPGVRLRADEQASIERLEHIEADDAVRRGQDLYRELEARLAALETFAQAVDPEFLGPQVAAFRTVARRQG